MFIPIFLLVLANMLFWVAIFGVPSFTRIITPQNVVLEAALQFMISGLLIAGIRSVFRWAYAQAETPTDRDLGAWSKDYLRICAWGWTFVMIGRVTYPFWGELVLSSHLLNP